MRLLVDFVTSGATVGALVRFGTPGLTGLSAFETVNAGGGYHIGLELA
jgi:hypothetical protein